MGEVYTHLGTPCGIPRVLHHARVLLPPCPGNTCPDVNNSPGNTCPDVNNSPGIFTVVYIQPGYTHRGVHTARVTPVGTERYHPGNTCRY